MGKRRRSRRTTFPQLPGYCGHLQGFNEAVEEEAWAFVFSTNLDGPMPQNDQVTVRLYVRVA